MNRTRQAQLILLAVIGSAIALLFGLWLVDRAR